MSRIRVTRLAQADLDDIWSYVAQDDLNAADRLMADIETRFKMLSRQPLIGEACEEIRPGLRSFPVGSYVIYYRLDGEGIAIVRVIHGARDVETLL